MGDKLLDQQGRDQKMLQTTLQEHADFEDSYMQIIHIMSKFSGKHLKVHKEGGRKGARETELEREREIHTQL